MTGTTLLYCAVTVNVGCQTLKQAKKVRKHSVEVVEPESGSAFVSIVGFQREFRITPRDIINVGEKSIPMGMLGFTVRDPVNTARTYQVLLKDAQPAQLQVVSRCLHGASGSQAAGLALAPVAASTPRASSTATLMQSVSTPQKKMARLSSEVTAAPSDDGKVSTARLPAISLCEFPTQVLEEMISFAPFSAGLARLAESCKQLDQFTIERRPTFRLGDSRGKRILPELVVRRVERHRALSVLDLSGYVELSSMAATALANALAEMALSSGGIRTLGLRGCKSLTDAPIRRLLTSSRNLEHLDLLQVPRLSDKALAAPLDSLRILAAGPLSRPLARPATVSASAAARKGHIVFIEGGNVAPAPPPMAPAAAGALKFSTALLARLGRPAGGESGGTPNLTHAILAQCDDIAALPRLPSTLRHLDLRGAGLVLPEAAAKGWCPLAGCRSLVVLCLSHVQQLGPAALLACVSSVPASARLAVLDLSYTQVDARLLEGLPQAQPRLTHLRLAGCRALGNAALTSLWARLSDLEVMDVAACLSLEGRVGDLPRPATPADAGSSTAGNGAVRPLAPKLRLLGVGQTQFALYIDVTRRELRAFAPQAHAVPGSLDIFRDYRRLPPELI